MINNGFVAKMLLRAVAAAFECWHCSASQVAPARQCEQKLHAAAAITRGPSAAYVADSDKDDIRRSHTCTIIQVGQQRMVMRRVLSRMRHTTIAAGLSVSALRPLAPVPPAPARFLTAVYERPRYICTTRVLSCGTLRQRISIYTYVRHDVIQPFSAGTSRRKSAKQLLPKLSPSSAAG